MDEAKRVQNSSSNSTDIAYPVKEYYKKSASVGAAAAAVLT